MRPRNNRTWIKKRRGSYVRVTRTDGRLFVSPLYPGPEGADDARPLSLRERMLWRCFGRAPRI
jgi:hypothetical protein